MIDELAEFEEYNEQHLKIKECLKRQNCADCEERVPSGFTFKCFDCPYYEQSNEKLDKLFCENKFRFRSSYFSTPGRVLRVIARYHLFHDDLKDENGELIEENDIVKKMEYIQKKLFDFYCDVILSKSVLYASELYGELNKSFLESLEEKAQEIKKTTKDKSIHSKCSDVVAGLRKLERYLRPYLEQKDNAFTFRSIIADAMNTGKLAGERKKPIEITVAEAVHLLKITGYNKSKGGFIPQVLVLALLCYYRATTADIKLRGDYLKGYLPIVGEDFNAWLHNTKAFGKKSEWEADPSFKFLDIVNITNSLCYRIDEDLLKAGVDGTNSSREEEDKKRIESLEPFGIADEHGNIETELKDVVYKARDFM